MLVYSLKKLRDYYQNSLTVLDGIKFQHAARIKLHKMFLFEQIKERITKKEEVLTQNESILRNALYNMPHFTKDRQKRKKIKLQRGSVFGDLKMLSFMSFFILSGVLLFISYRNNEIHRQENQDSLV